MVLPNIWNNIKTETILKKCSINPLLAWKLGSSAGYKRSKFDVQISTSRITRNANSIAPGIDDDMIYLLTAIGLSPGGSNTHLHTNNT